MAGKKAEEMKQIYATIINLLMERGSITCNQIIAALESRLGIKRSRRATIIDYIKALREQGFPIAGGDNDGYHFEVESDKCDIIKDKPDPKYTKISDDTITEWLLMFIISKNNKDIISRKILMDQYFELTGIENTKTAEEKVRQRIAALIDKKIIFRQKSNPAITPEDFFSISDNAPVLSLMPKDDAYEFNDLFTYEGEASELKNELEVINDKISRVLPDAFEPSNSYKSSGRINDVDQKLLDKLDELLALPFKKKALKITFTSKTNGNTECVFKTGLIVFSIEKNTFYLLGKTGDKRIIIRLDSIIKATVVKNKNNDIFESKEFMRIFRRMWAVNVDDPEEIVVFFQNAPHIRAKIKDLQRIRSSTAEVSFPADDDTDGWIRYSDTLSGLSDFLPFIRSLGSSAVIESPGRLRDLMIEKTLELKKLYEEVLENV